MSNQKTTTPKPPAMPQARKPTCTVAPPCILLAGGDGAGKSYTAAMLTASPKVGRSWWLELGETTADEYGLIEVGGEPVRYESLVHDGTWASIMDRVTEVRDYARWVQETGSEKPVALVVDGMSAEWDMQHDYANARHRASAKNRRLLAEDPNAEIGKAGRNIWNDTNDRHDRLMTMLVTFPGIVIMTARAGEVSDTDQRTGQPYADGRKIWRVDGQFNLRYQARCTIRLDRGQQAQVVSCRSVSTDLAVLPDDPPVKLPKGWTLEDLIFSKFRYDPQTSHARELIRPVTDRTPENVRDEACDPRTDYTRLGQLYAICENQRWFEVTLTNEHGDEENLMAMIKRLGIERKPGPAGQQAPGEPATAASGTAGGTDQEWLGQITTRIATFTLAREADAIGTDIKAKVEAGQCTNADRLTLSGLYATRVAALRKAEQSTPAAA